jgi:hypothetical protein
VHVLKKVLVINLTVLVIVMAVGLFLPTTYRLDRSVVIRATPQRVHAWVGDLERWEAWEPFRKGDPSIRVTPGDKTRGVGASQSWTGDSGQGELVFTKSDADHGVAYDLLFEQGQYRARAAVGYERDGDATKVTWTMSGDIDTPILGGYFALLIKKMTGAAFAQGLADLKQAVESDEADGAETTAESARDEVGEPETGAHED